VVSNMGLQVCGSQAETESNATDGIRDLKVFKERRDLKVPKGRRVRKGLKVLKGLRVRKDFKAFKEMWGMLGKFCILNVFLPEVRPTDKSICLIRLSSLRS